jgi:hypothetical protein
MIKIMRMNALIKKINKEIPEAKATPGIEFDENYKDAIWFRGSEDYGPEDELIYNAWSSMTDGVHPRLAEILEDANWYAEPYDSGTLFAFN